MLYGRLAWIAFFESPEEGARLVPEDGATAVTDILSDLGSIESLLESNVHVPADTESESVDWKASMQASIAKLHASLVLQRSKLESIAVVGSSSVDAGVRDTLGQLKSELDDLKTQFSGQEEVLKGLVDKLQAHEASQESNTAPETEAAEAALESKIEKIVSSAVLDAVETYSSDRIGRPDFALYSMGTRPLAWLSTEPLRRLVDPLSRFLGIGVVGKPHRMALQPDMSVGQCWSFAGSSGHMTIELPRAIQVSHVSIDHIGRAVALDRSSAPRHFEIFGLLDAAEAVEPGIFLGSFEYALSEGSVQTFALQPTSEAFKYLSLRILSNWGHSEYTCLYRWRVHSDVEEQQADSPSAS